MNSDNYYICEAIRIFQKMSFISLFINIIYFLIKRTFLKIYYKIVYERKDILFIK